MGHYERGESFHPDSTGGQLQQGPALESERRGEVPRIIRGGSLVRSLRGEMSQREFARIIGTTKTSVSRWETNRKPLDLARFEVMLYILDVPEERKRQLRDQIEGYPTWIVPVVETMAEIFLQGNRESSNKSN